MQIAIIVHGEFVLSAKMYCEIDSGNRCVKPTAKNNPLVKPLQYAKDDFSLSLLENIRGMDPITIAIVRIDIAAVYFI